MTSAAASPGRAPARGGRLPRSARREQLLGAALEVFVAQGYHAAAMDDIADRAGVSKPILYQHFPGKLELYLALLDHHTETLLGTVQAALDSTHDNKLRIRATISAYYDFVDREGAAYRLVFESDLRNEPAVGERVDALTRKCMLAVAETITADTGAAQAQAELLAMGLVGAAEISARSWLDGDRPVPKDEAIDLLTSLLWRGVSSFPLTHP